MNATQGFAAMYSRPDLDAVEREVRALDGACRAAPTAADLLRHVEEWNRLRTRVDTHQQIAHVRFHQDTRDAGAVAEEDFWNDASGRLREFDTIHARAMLESRFREAIDRAYGPQFLALKRCASVVFADSIRDAINDEARLGARYTTLTAEAGIEFRGERLNLFGIGRYLTDGDRTTRLEAHQARESFLSVHGEELDDLFDRLVKLRDQMARTLGHATFTPLGYQLLSRTGYDARAVAGFRDEIQREVVPVVSALLQEQASRLGVAKILYHDEGVADPQGNPRPLGDGSFCVEQARRMYAEFGKEPAEFIEAMKQGDLFDLMNRPGKAPGGFCTIFADLGMPFVFANFNGTDADVTVFTHECGHAFQAYQSRTQPLLEYRFPTTEACEIHSMGMEYLAWPWMDLFFGESEAERYRVNHLKSRLMTLPYLALVDHFQHEVYAMPGMKPRERNQLWRELERVYQPHRDYGGAFPYFDSGALWQRQLHVYRHPFYYIDYALAQTCALQIWRKSRIDRPATVRDYLALCGAGGSLEFSELVALGNLRSPFDPGCLGEIVREVR